MFGLSALDLARIQFGFTVSFHIIFPAITIGLASYLAVLEGLWLWRKDRVYRDLYLYWSRIFAVTFAMGVVSGIVMAYQFGTNWSYFSAFAGGVTGPLLAYEVLTAFFLEAGFLGVMLFGWKKVGPELHFFATLMVAFGTLVSASWILASNSWMQTPQGYEIVGGRVVPVDWFKVIFNPSFPYRLVHMTLAAYLATALFVGAAGAWHLLRGENTVRVRTMFSMALWMLLVVTPVQIFAGDAHGLNTLEHQPAKIAAIEGHWRDAPGEQGTPLILFGWPDMAREETLYKIEVPRLGGLILAHDWDGKFKGLSDFPPNERPNSTVVFWTFRVMVGLGLLMLALAVWGLLLRPEGRLYGSRVFQRFALLMGPSGLVALLAGWLTTEIGRQPYVVYGVMRTADAVSNHSGPVMGLTLSIFVVLYCVVFGTGVYYLLSIVGHPPKDLGPVDGPPTGGLEGGPLDERPARPMSAAPDASF